MPQGISRRNWFRATSAAAATTAAATATTTPGQRAGQPALQVATNCEMCFWRCGALAQIQNGRVARIEGNPQHPLTQGRLCARGNAGHQTLYDPDRLKRPQLRTGARGEGRFQEISWEQALDWFAARLSDLKSKYGPESVAILPHGVSSGFFSTLMKAYGTPNSAEPAFAQCRGPREVGYALTFGRGVGSPEPLDLANAKAVVLIGSHLGENVFTSQITQFADGLSKGAQLIVVDPRFSTAASKATQWLPIRPGTDIALLLAWMNVILAEGLEDKDYLAKHAHGLDELRAHVKPFTPEWASAETELPAAQIRDTARMMAAAKPAVVLHPGRHVTWYGDDTQRARAMAILTALLGAWGRSGGVLLPTALKRGSFKLPPFPESKRGRADGAGTTYPLASEEQGVTNGIVEATLTAQPYPIKSWIVYGQNVLESIPQRERTLAAIKLLDLFVVVDILPVEQTLYADLILPEATYLERYDAPHIVESAARPFISLRQPAVAPLHDSRPGWWIAKQMAARLGLDAWFPWKNPDEHLSKLIEPMGISLSELKARGAMAFEGRPTIEQRTEADGPLFPTESGKIELSSKTLKELGHDPIPIYHPPADPPPGWFRLLYGRAPVHSFARTENNALLNGLMSENTVWMNDHAARDLGLAPGARIVLQNSDGSESLPVAVQPTAAIRKDCVYMAHGFGQQAPGLHKANARGASDTPLISRVKIDPLMGGTGMRVNFVRVKPEVHT
ncbi:MAG: molybdopterin-dependent oxidoreductase [Acidobacteria bacterium]|nr:molybdopterin-dependent oxidoreductase [Acidobacteriota bacterium]